jgi:hypothetical protein
MLTHPHIIVSLSQAHKLHCSLHSPQEESDDDFYSGEVDTPSAQSTAADTSKPQYTPPAAASTAGSTLHLFPISQVSEGGEPSAAIIDHTFMSRWEEHGQILGDSHHRSYALDIRTLNHVWNLPVVVLTDWQW